MTKCPYCSRENPDTTSVCSECGSDLVTPAVEDQQDGNDEGFGPIASATAITLCIYFGTAFLSGLSRVPLGFLVFPGVAIWAAYDSGQWRRRVRACLEPDEMLPHLAASNATKPFAAFAFSLFFCWGFPCYLIARHSVKQLVEAREGKVKQTDAGVVAGK